MKQENIVKKLRKIMPECISNMLFVNHYHVKKFTKFAVSQLKEGSKILDAGAGECPYKDYFKAFQYHACDLKVGDETWNYSNINFECDLENIPIKSNTYDAVLCYNILEHVPYPSKIIAEFYRILKKNGKLFIAVPQEWKLHQEPHNYFNFTKYGLNLVLKDAGFKVNFARNGEGYFHYMSTRLSESTALYFQYMKNPALILILLPFFVIHALIFSVFFPIILFPFDFLDKERAHTSNIFAFAEKPGSPQD